MGEPSAPTQPPPLDIAAALRKWIDANERQLIGWKGTGRIVITASFNSDANKGAGEVRVMLGT